MNLPSKLTYKLPNVANNRGSTVWSSSCLAISTPIAIVIHISYKLKKIKKIAFKKTYTWSYLPNLTYKFQNIVNNQTSKIWSPIYLGILTPSIPTLHSSFSNMNFGFNFGTQINYLRKKPLPRFDAKASLQSCRWARN